MGVTVTFITCFFLSWSCGVFKKKITGSCVVIQNKDGSDKKICIDYHNYEDWDITGAEDKTVKSQCDNNEHFDDAKSATWSDANCDTKGASAKCERTGDDKGETRYYYDAAANHWKEKYCKEMDGEFTALSQTETETETSTESYLYCKITMDSQKSFCIAYLNATDSGSKAEENCSSYEDDNVTSKFQPDGGCTTEDTKGTCVLPASEDINVKSVSAVFYGTWENEQEYCKDSLNGNYNN